jgi:hypothetical protein
MVQAHHLDLLREDVSILVLLAEITNASGFVHQRHVPVIVTGWLCG